jgi:uncharacterized protein
VKRWFLGNLPTREGLLANRWLKPFAHRLEHPLLWHMNRRSIARGIALGLFAGFLLPIGQIFLAALLAMTVRANVLIAAGATLITNPFTFPPIYFAAYKLGCGITGMKAAPANAPETPDMFMRLHHVATPTVVGLLLFAFISSLAGYLAVHIFWRWRLSRRWNRRRAFRAARMRRA